MKKAIFFALLVFGVWLFFAQNVSAAEKFGSVDLAKLFDEYSKTKTYDKILADKEKAYETERDKKVAEIKQLQEKYTLLSDKEKESKKTEIENKIRALEDFDKARQSELLKERDEKLKEILNDIEKAVEQYAQAQGYTVIFNERFLVYQNTSLDITDNVLDILKASGKGK